MIDKQTLILPTKKRLPGEGKLPNDENNNNQRFVIANLNKPTNIILYQSIMKFTKYRVYIFKSVDPIVGTALFLSKNSLTRKTTML